jgi:hypothetical protein
MRFTKHLIKISAMILLGIVILCAISFLLEKKSYTKWEISNRQQDSANISWAEFKWGSATLNGKYFERAYMIIPCKIEGIPNTTTFQFDLGADLSGIYENTFRFSPTLNKYTNDKINRLRSPLQFWNTNKCFNDLTIRFGNYTITNKTGFVYKNYGETPKDVSSTDTIHAGTIGSDLFKNKVLLIDYPNQQFAICDSVPVEYKQELINIELDNHGRAILPMKIHEQSYRILFDNGSSLFPLITEAKNISAFSTLPDTDTITISSWGKTHDVTGKLITDTFELGVQKFSNAKIYANHSGLGIDKNTDGMAGNALFWDKMMIIDFRNKKFGIQ